MCIRDSIVDDFFQIFKDDPLYNHIADIVHGTVGSVTSVIPADIIVLFSRLDVYKRQRHTFCTRLASKNMNPKDLQYIMGLSLIHIFLAVFWACVYCIRIGMDDPFLYFRF